MRHGRFGCPAQPDGGEALDADIPNRRYLRRTIGAAHADHGLGTLTRVVLVIRDTFLGSQLAVRVLLGWGVASTMLFGAAEAVVKVWSV